MYSLTFECEWDLSHMYLTYYGKGHHMSLMMSCIMWQRVMKLLSWQCFKTPSQHTGASESSLFDKATGYVVVVHMSRNIQVDSWSLRGTWGWPLTTISGKNTASLMPWTQICDTEQKIQVSQLNLQNWDNKCVFI